MKEILKKIVNFLKQSDKLKHCLVNLLVMLIAGSINIWLGIGLAVGLSLGKEYGDSNRTFISSYIIEKASTYLVLAFICIIIFSALSLTSRAEFLLPI